jgi:hypothetical protein
MASEPLSNGGRLLMATRPVVKNRPGTVRGWFGKWLESLRSTLGSWPSGFPKSRDR